MNDSGSVELLPPDRETARSVSRPRQSVPNKEVTPPQRTVTPGQTRAVGKRPLWLLAPAAILLCVVVAIPAAVNVYISFFNVTIYTIHHWYSTAFQGIGNYVEALGGSNIVSGSALHSLWVSVTFALLATAISSPIGFLAALSVNHRFRGRGLVRSWFLVPYVIPGVVTAMLGRALFLNGTGLVDTIIGATGVGSTNTFWLVGGRAFWAMLAMEVWAVWPFMYIMVLSGLSSIPTDLYEAAAIDGASKWAVIRYVVVPGLRNVLLLGVLLSTIFHLGNFTLPFVMFNTPPPLSVDVLPVSIFFNAFVENQYSLGAAIAVFMVVVVFIPGILYVRMSRLGRNGANT